MLQTGIDVMILKGPARHAVVDAVHRHAGVERSFIAAADDRHPLELDGVAPDRWAVIHSFEVGEIAFKVDLNARAPADFATIAQHLARELGSPVAWPDEGTLSPMAFIISDTRGMRRPCILHDIDGSGGELLGFTVHPPLHERDL